MADKHTIWYGMFMIAFISSLLAAAILVLIALLHVYWTMGGYFPAKDADSLAQTVVGGQAGMVKIGRAHV